MNERKFLENFKTLVLNTFYQRVLKVIYKLSFRIYIFTSFFLVQSSSTEEWENITWNESNDMIDTQEKK